MHYNEKLKAIKKSIKETASLTASDVIYFQEQVCHSVTVCSGCWSVLLQYLSLGFALEHVICVFEGSFKGFSCVALQRLLFTQSNVEVSGSVGGSVHPSMAVKHSVVGTLYSVLDHGTDRERNQKKFDTFVLFLTVSEVFIYGFLQFLES